MVFFVWKELFFFIENVVRMSLELFRIRQKRFAELVDKADWELLTTEFPRSVVAWEKRLDHESVIEEAVACCRKCPDFWLRLLESVEDPEVYMDALEAVGLDWDGHKVVDKVKEFLDKSGLSLDRFSRIVSRNSKQDGNELFEIKQRYEPMVFPKNLSSFHMPPEAAQEYVGALGIEEEEVESLLQRLVFWYNDDLGSWRMYCDWLKRGKRYDDLMYVLDKACSEYVAYNPNMWAMTGKYASEIGQRKKGCEWSREALNRNCEFLECAWIEEISSILPIEEWSGLYSKDSLQGLFVKYLQWGETGEQIHLEDLVETLKSRNNVDLSEAELCLFCYAFGELGNRRDARIDRILKHNAHVILRLLPECDSLRSQVVELVEGTTSAPLPVCKAPPKPVVHANTQNLPKRPLPGYTAGWMAEEYAKKHKI